MAIFSIADTFIKRPVLTTVCTILIVLVGAICIPLLPVNNLPDIAPIQVNVTSAYQGADAQTVETSVTNIMERQINGVEGMEFITSSSTNTGASSIQVFFGTDTDKNIDQVNVQNKVAIAQPQLPDTVKQNGVTVKTASTSILLIYGFNTDNNQYDSTFISNYLDLFITDTLKRVPGVGDVSIVGERKYAMRIWLNPNALASRGLSAADVVSAVQSQNVQVGVGTIGAQPTPTDQSYTFPVRVQGRFKDESDFANLVVKVQPDGTLVKLRDVGRVELGAENYETQANVNGQPGVGLLIYQQPGSNAVDVAAKIKETIAQLEKDFPPGLKSNLVYDITEFIEASQEEVVQTLIEAIALVILVIFIFLQDWRTTIIPAVAIPVSLMGTMAFAYVLGFSLNTLTMFGLILATGLVVDDGIVVVEAISTKMQQGMGAREAALEAMNELTGAVIATSLVLLSVFIPVSFFPGATGIMYKQFALVIVFSIVISTFNALSFSPSMAGILLRHKEGEGKGPLAWFFWLFNRSFDFLSALYRTVIQLLIRLRWIVVAIFVAGLVATAAIYQAVPSGFIPEEDQGIFLGIVQAPEGVPLNYTNQVADDVYRVLSQVPEIEGNIVITGFGLDGNGANKATFFAKLKNWKDRPHKDQSVKAILGRLNKEFFQNQQAIVQAFNLPAVPGFGTTGGFEFQLQDQSGKLTFDEFFTAANEIIAKANHNPALSRVFTQFTTNTPQLEIVVNRDQLNTQNVDFSQALSTLSAYIGSRYVNDFTYGQRSYRVYVQADQNFRSKPEDLLQVYVRSRDNKLVRFGEFAQIKQITGPSIIAHFNLFRSIKLQGNPAPGYSSGQAIQAMEQSYKEAAIPGLGYEWSGLTREEIKSGGQTVIIFGLGLVMVFLVLAAQYENYIDPIIILLSVPMAILGAMLFIDFDPRELVNDLYCQIALVMLIGLASKNAILIVEFANQSRETGMSVVQSAIHASKERFRPILMTALSTLVGFWPLVTASGAGAASRWSLGVAVFGGLVVATITSFLLVPVLYVVIKNLAEFALGGKKRPKPPEPPTPPSEPAMANNGAVEEELEPVPDVALVPDDTGDGKNPKITPSAPTPPSEESPT